jgi:hypothetical protein
MMSRSITLTWPVDESGREWREHTVGEIPRHSGGIELVYRHEHVRERRGG